MDFFEALSEKAIQRLVTEGGYDPVDGVGATIEALKEMMVGEPMKNQLRHDEGWEYHGHPILDPTNRSLIPITVLENEVMVHEGGYIHTDGEEVVVIVFKNVQEA